MNIPLFAAVLQHIHSFALKKILLEHAKLPAVRPPLPGCSCTIQQSYGLPCYHTIWERKCNGGVILLTDIHRHWYYDRPVVDTLESDTSLAVLRPVLNLVCVRGKGRPRGALNEVARVAKSSTRRHLSS